MKKILLLIFVSLLVGTCDIFHEDYSKFAGAYKKILIARELNQDDSLNAKKEIDKIYREYNLTEESFKEEYYYLNKKNPKKFQEILDSLREEIQRELTKYQMKIRKKDKE